jgi:hypothetical protein
MKTLFTFKQALEIVMFLIIALMAKTLEGQIPDTIYYKQIQTYNQSEQEVYDSLGNLIETVTVVDTIESLVIYTGRKLPNTNEYEINVIDRLMDSSEVAEYAFDLILRVEEENYMDIMRLKERENLTKLYAPVNNIIRDMQGYGFFVKTRQMFGRQFEGRWIARINGGDIIWLKVDKFMNVTETTQRGEVVEGGRSGRFLLYTNMRMKVTGLFDDVIDFREYWNKERRSPFWMMDSDGNRVMLRKID